MKRNRVVGFVAAAVLAAGCTVHDINEPSLAGPSEMALALSISATPDRIAQDGVSTSTVQITAHNSITGTFAANVELRLAIYIGDQPVDFGTLGAPTVFTNSNGRASTTFRAPLAPPFLAGGPSKVVSIVATVVGSNYSVSSHTGRAVDIQVTPPPAPSQVAGAPVAILAVTGTAAKVGTTVLFDGTKSYAEPGHSIVAWSWDFGDGLTNDEHGFDASHIYVTPGTYYAVLGVVDDLGRTDSDIKTIVVAP